MKFTTTVSSNFTLLSGDAHAMNFSAIKSKIDKYI